jgi:hypothetical protein
MTMEQRQLYYVFIEDRKCRTRRDPSGQTDKAWSPSPLSRVTTMQPGGGGTTRKGSGSPFMWAISVLIHARMARSDLTSARRYRNLSTRTDAEGLARGLPRHSDTIRERSDSRASSARADAPGSTPKEL